MGKKKTPNVPTQVIQQAQTQYETTREPSAAENEMSGVSQQFMNNYNQANQRQTADYGNMMKGYEDFRNNLGGPTKFNVMRPPQLDEAYGNLSSAGKGYQNFADTGGYSPTDIQELRARGTSPIRAAYGNSMMEMDRARSLGNGAPNYIAAASKAQRELPGQLADATTGVNAQLADSIRQGKLAGLGGLSQVGGVMGGLAGDESGRDLQAQNMGEQSLQNLRQSQLASYGGQASLYGTTPGMSSMFGNQALSAFNQRAGMEQSRNSTGMGLLGMQLEGQNTKNQGTPWWKTALSVAGTVAPYVAMAASSREFKEDIRPVKTGNFTKKLKELQLYTWKYKGDNVKHFGPIAEEFKDTFGVGDGKTIHLADVMGVMLASQKEALADA
jgi:hypothetical protein